MNKNLEPFLFLCSNYIKEKKTKNKSLVDVLVLRKNLNSLNNCKFLDKLKISILLLGLNIFCYDIEKEEIKCIYCLFTINDYSNNELTLKHCYLKSCKSTRNIFLWKYSILYNKNSLERRFIRLSPKIR